MQDNAYLHLAYISAIKMNWTEAYELAVKSVLKNFHSLKARHLKALSLRVLGRTDDAIAFITETLKIDAFDYASRFELAKCYIQQGRHQQANEQTATIQKLISNRPYTYIEMAQQYIDAGCFNEAVEFLSLINDRTADPMVYYYLGFAEKMRNRTDEAIKQMGKAFQQSPDKVFPNRIEDIEVLNTAIEMNPEDYKAYYYLGNFYYAKRLYNKAREAWERSVRINGNFATTLRNLGLAYYNKFDKKKEALQLFEKAFKADPSDSRILFELDQLYKKFNKVPRERLAFLKQHENLVNERDDLYTEYVTLHSLTGNFEKAKQYLQARSFHPWEGGEGKTSGQHILINIELAKKALQDGALNQAEALLMEAQQFPDNIGEGKLHGAQENDIFYWLGCVYEAKGLHTEAKAAWQKASTGPSEPMPAVFYNDQQPDKIFYQGMALLKLEDKEAAKQRFNNLIKYGKKHRNDTVKMDFFAVSLPDLMIFDDDLSLKNRAHCLYLIGLGYLGLQQYARAKSYFKDVFEIDQSHGGATQHLPMADARVVI